MENVYPWTDLSKVAPSGLSLIYVRPVRSRPSLAARGPLSRFRIERFPQGVASF